jgi:2-iminoacetate synthase ThiH
VSTLAALWQGIDPAVLTILEAALAGQELTAAQALQLLALQGRALTALVLVADALRQQQVGDVLTYVKVRNINFTNVCYTGCQF